MGSQGVSLAARLLPLFSREVRPGGYPHLGLRSAKLKVGDNPSAADVLAAVEAAERSDGLESAPLRRADRVPVPLLLEYAHTYLGLRRRYLGVRPDFCDVAATLRPEFATSYLYATNFPVSAAAAAHSGSGEPVELARRDPGVAAELSGWLRQTALRPADLRRHGSIVLSSDMAKAGFSSTLDGMERRAVNIARRGGVRYMARTATSFQAAVLAHEFGHLLDAAIWERGGGLAERVYAAVSTVVEGVPADRSADRWSANLVNYPSVTLPAGPAAGGAARAKVLRRVKRPVIAAKLGRYAASCREELFAELFMYATCGGEPELRSAWRALVEPLLVDAGLMVPRR